MDRHPAMVAKMAGQLDSLLRQRPAWLMLDDAGVPEDLLAQVPQQPTLVLGLGGSALGARAVLAVAKREGAVRHEVRVLDSLDRETVRDALAWADGVGAALHVVSKSGGTTEVLALLALCLERAIGVSTPIVFVSDPIESPIRTELAATNRKWFHIAMPEPVGGRYSVFTAVGQVPLRAAGADAGTLLRGARAYAEVIGADLRAAPCVHELSWRLQNPAANSVLMSYADALLPWAFWLQQLECESLGRRLDNGKRVGELVVVLRGPADQHSIAQLLLDGPVDKRVCICDFVAASAHPDGFGTIERLCAIERDATFDALELPTMRVLVRPNLYSLGALMLHGMIVTVIMASELGVSPYGQPAVEAIKRGIRARLGDQAT